jgi:hypothetical protein
MVVPVRLVVLRKRLRAAGKSEMAVRVAVRMAVDLLSVPMQQVGA